MITYSSIIESYELCADELRKLELDVATEAEGTSVDRSTVQASNATDNANNTLDDKTNDPAQRNMAFKEKVKKIIDTIRGAVMAIIDKISQLVTNLMLTNKGFLKEMEEARKMYKVVDSLQVINWTYPNNPDQFLMTPLNLLGGEIKRQVANLSHFENIPEDSILLMNETDRTQAILRLIKAPSDVTNVSQYYLHLRTQFRGKKQEQTIPGTMADQYMAIIQNYDRKKTAFIQTSKSIKMMVDNTNSTLQRVANNSNAEPEVKARVLKMANALINMVNIYSTLAVLANRMYGEYIINCRTIVRHLYQK